MKRSLKKLEGYSIEAKDGMKGSVKDFLFDEKRWVVRYLEAGLGTLLPGRRVLIPRVFLDTPEWSTAVFPVKLSKKEIEHCPELKEHLPVSRQYEKTLNQYYNIEDYWSITYAYPVGAQMATYPPRPLNIPEPDKIKAATEMDVRLRSFNEIRGYEIAANDGTFGQIYDVIIDDIDWQVVYVVVDTQKWMPWSKKVLIRIDWMEKVDYFDSEIRVNLDMEEIKEAPEFDPANPVNEVYEKKLYDFYGRPVEQ